MKNNETISVNKILNNKINDLEKVEGTMNIVMLQFNLQNKIFLTILETLSTRAGTKFDNKDSDRFDDDSSSKFNPLSPEFFLSNRI